MYDYVLHGLTITSIYLVMALGLNLQVGLAGLLNFGHIAFVGIGAYGMAIGSAAGLPFIACLAVGASSAALLGWVMARLGRNLGADYWAIATLALAEILRVVALNENWLTGGAQGMGNIPRLFSAMAPPLNRHAFLLTSVALAFLVWAISQRLQNGRFGRALRMLREQPSLAESCGYDLVQLKVKIMITGAIIASVAGGFFASYMSYVGPEYMLATETFFIWTMIIIGGLGNNTGIILGAVLVQSLYLFIPFLKDWLNIGSDISGALRLGMLGLVLLLCLLLRPQGLLPERVRKLA